MHGLAHESVATDALDGFDAAVAAGRAQSSTVARIRAFIALAADAEGRRAPRGGERKVATGSKDESCAALARWINRWSRVAGASPEARGRR